MKDRNPERVESHTVTRARQVSESQLLTQLEAQFAAKAVSRSFSPSSFFVSFGGPSMLRLTNLTAYAYIDTMATPRPVELPGESGNPQVALAVFFIEFRQRHAAAHQKFCPLPPPVRVNGFMILSSMILSLFVPFRVFPVSRGPELNPHRVQFFASTQAAACPRPCGQIRPNQTTFIHNRQKPHCPCTTIYQPLRHQRRLYRHQSTKSGSGLGILPPRAAPTRCSNTRRGSNPDPKRLSGERDRPGRIRRRPADGPLRIQQFHPFRGSSCVSLMIGGCNGV